MAIQISNWVTELQKRTNLQGTDRILMGLSSTGESLYTTVADLAGVVTGSTVVNRGNWASGTEYTQGDYVFAESTASPGERSMYFLIGINPYVSTIPPKDDLSKWSELPAIKGDQGPQGPKGDKGDPLTWDDLTPVQKDSLKGDVGDSGWSMLVRAEVDNVNLDPDGQYRKVLYVYDWVGGEGTKPTITGYIGVSGIVANIVNAENWRGSIGAQGIQGDPPAHEWVGTSVRFQNPDGSWGALTDLQGAQGLQGIQGDPPAHEWDDTRLRFQNPNGTWGAYVDLKGDKGDRGEAFTIDASGLFADRVDYDSEPEGFTFLATDLGEMYIRKGAAGNWSDGIPFGKGDPGEGVPAGGTTGQLLRKKSNTDYDTEFFTLDLSPYATIIDLVGDPGQLPFTDSAGTGIEKRKIAPADLNMFTVGTILGNIGGNLGELNLSSSVANSAVAQRTTYGSLKASDAVANDDLVALGQLLTKLNDYVLKEAGKVLSSNDFTNALLNKLNGIATGATANQTDAYLLDRGNHTGTQAMATITGLITALADKVDSSDVIGSSGDLPFTNSAGDGIELRKITGSDLGINTTGTRIPTHTTIGWQDGGFPAGVNPADENIVIRTMGGRGRFNPAENSNEAVTLGQADSRYLQSQRYKAVHAVAANRTIAVTDEDCLWIITGTRTLTVPANASVNFPIGGRIDVQVNAGATANITGASGVALTHKDGTGDTSRGGFTMFTFIKTAANAWTIGGG